MNLNKHIEFFNPLKIEQEINIIGLGAIGSHVAMQLARLGLTNIHLYDFDNVEEINVANQNYFKAQAGLPKTAATVQTLNAINPDITIQLHEEGWNGELLSGYVFLCVDNIDLRRDICLKNKHNRYIKAIFDFRMGLADAQHYAADWAKSEDKDKLIDTMDFTHEEAKRNTPVSACGTSLSVIPTILTVTAAGIANFINFCREQPLKHMVLVNPFMGTCDAF